MRVPPGVKILKTNISSFPPQWKKPEQLVLKGKDSYKEKR